MRVFSFISAFLFSVILLETTERTVPIIEDYQLKGYENTDFINVLLNPSDPISNFYSVTENGNVLRIENMSNNPNVNNVFSFDGEITGAITYDSTHYIALSNINQSFLISTRDFKEIDTLYSILNNKISDFKIDLYDDKIFLLQQNEINSKIIYRELEISHWNEIEVPNNLYNRLFVTNNKIYLYKHLNEEISFFKYGFANQNWSKVTYDSHEVIGKISDVKCLDTTKYLYNYKLYLFGDLPEPPDDFSNDIYIFDDSMEILRYGPTGPIDKTSVLLDFELHADAEFRTNETYQVGKSKNEEGEDIALFHKYVYDGSDHVKNKHYFDYSSSLNKIKSNERSRDMEFVAVGNDGIILIINRGATPVLEEEKGDTKSKNFIVYPNLVKGNSTVYIQSNKIIDKIELMDLTGRKVFTKTGISQFEHYLELQDLNSGMYFIKINGEVQKLLVE